MMTTPLAPEPTTRRERQLEHELIELRTRLAEALQHSAHLEAIVVGAPLAIFVKGSDHRYRFVNAQYARLCGRTRDEILGATDFDLFPAPVAQLFREQDEEVTSKARAVEFTESVPLPDGVHSFITAKFPLPGPTRAPVGVAGLCTDITELERAHRQLEEVQAELVRAERLAALGELSAVVAHEVRNPLGAICNALAGLRRGPPAPPEARALLDVIDEEADRLNRMVTALLELARPASALLEPTAVPALVRSAVSAALAAHGAHAEGEVQVELPEALPLAELDGPKVVQALSNLVLNALQSPARRGPVVVRVCREADALALSVIDDGAGVPPELAERVFQPFFTTRAAGTGLGLALVQRVMEAHQGTARVEPTPGGGATFVLRLPIRA